MNDVIIYLYIPFSFDTLKCLGDHAAITTGVVECNQTDRKTMHAKIMSHPCFTNEYHQMFGRPMSKPIHVSWDTMK